MNLRLLEAKVGETRNISFSIDKRVLDEFIALSKKYNYNRSKIIEMAMEKIVAQIKEEQGMI